MAQLLTAAQMREIEQKAIRSGDVTGLELMERAGAGVVGAVFKHWPALGKTRHRALVLCGPGNNGGDGFVIARLLKVAGWHVEVLFWGDVDKLSADARHAQAQYAAIGQIDVLTLERASTGARPTLLVDAMFGTGLRRAIPLELAQAFHAVEKRDVGGSHPWHVPFYKVAVDCPSGLDCDSGKFLFPQPPMSDDGLDENVDALWHWWKEDASKRLLHVDLTLPFHRRKIGHALNGGLGKVRVVDIGLGKDDLHPAHLLMPRPSDWVTGLDFKKTKGRSRRIWPGSELDKARGAGRHKFDHGHALVLSGGAGKTGAARLAARGALRIGAGLVTIGAPPAAQMEVAGQITALMLKRVQDDAGLADLLQDDRINALCLGPGMGIDRARNLVPAALGAATAPRVVLDADALSAFEDDPAALMAMLHPGCVLTPHGGEFARLFPDIDQKFNASSVSGPAYSKVDATRDAARRAGCVVLFKGADTVIADSDGRCSVHAAHYERAAPWLATAGSGDVLAGFITGLLARGCAPMQAAEIGAYLHVECARRFGPGLIAEDLPEQIPDVLRNLGV